MLPYRVKYNTEDGTWKYIQLKILSLLFETGN